jgi:hypothetical protein
LRTINAAGGDVNSMPIARLFAPKAFHLSRGSEMPKRK